jgi:hypothetical protein
VSRREFLRTASTAAALAAAGRLPGGLAEENGRSLVVESQSDGWRTADGKVDAAVVRRMIDSGLMRLTGKDTPEAAWRSLFAPGEVVGLKFNRVSRDYTGANQAALEALAAGLGSAGVPTGHIIVLEAENAALDGSGTPQRGWAGEYDFGSGKTRLSNTIVNQVDALINVANLKHHPIAAFTGCLKNLSHAKDTLMEGPARFHGNGCDPFIADICALDPLREKTRLHVMNGLKGIFDRGAYPPAPQFQWDRNGMFVGFDPVAIDAVGAQIVDSRRAEAQGRELRRDPRALKYLATAEDRGLGVAELARIEHVGAVVD